MPGRVYLFQEGTNDVPKNVAAAMSVFKGKDYHPVFHACPEKGRDSFCFVDIRAKGDNELVSKLGEIGVELVAKRAVDIN
jgi:hypothetical protein